MKIGDARAEMATKTYRTCAALGFKLGVLIPATNRTVEVRDMGCGAGMTLQLRYS